MARPVKKWFLVEWQTFLLMLGCYGGWALATTWIAGVSHTAGFIATTLMITLHSSLQHEVLHGHPFRSRRLSEAMVFPALGLLIPYCRFRDTHLAHHQDSILTDPYDDPESNFLDPGDWEKTAAWRRVCLNFNNTLFGRLLIGPLISQVHFMRADGHLIRNGVPGIMLAWILHGAGVALVIIWLFAVGQMPLWLYFLAAYCGLSILKIRTFLEHRAHEAARGRTVIINDRGPLAFLFLNNNLHVVHHMHPAVPWYQLRGLFTKNKDRYLGRNDGYYYKSYGEVFRKYFLHRKDPVAHPLWRR